MSKPLGGVSPPISFRLYRLDEVGETTGLSQSSLRRAIRQGRLIVHRIGRAIRVSEADLARFLNHSRKGGRR